MTVPLTEFRIVRPNHLDEAVAARQAHPSGRFIAGGTDLLVNMRHGINRPDVLIDLSGLPELSGLRCGSDGATIGASVTIAALARNTAIAAQYPALVQAASSIAGPGHRAMGTVGGNLCLDTRCNYYNQSEWWRRSNGYCLKSGGDTCRVAPKGARCHAAFTGDLAPALLVLAADVEIAGPAGLRRVPLAGIYADDGRAHLTLADGELIVAVRLPANPFSSAYEKIRPRRSIDYPLAGVATALSIADARIAALRIALTGTNSRPFLLDGTGDLTGHAIDEQTLQRIDRMVQKQVQPMRTTLVPANYRRLTAAAVARRLVAKLSEDFRG